MSDDDGGGGDDGDADDYDATAAAAATTDNDGGGHNDNDDDNDDDYDDDDDDAGAKWVKFIYESHATLTWSGNFKRSFRNRIPVKHSWAIMGSVEYSKAMYCFLSP